jgi:hypothetical protein
LIRTGKKFQNQKPSIEAKYMIGGLGVYMLKALKICCYVQILETLFSRISTFCYQFQTSMVI